MWIPSQVVPLVQPMSLPVPRPANHLQEPRHKLHREQICLRSSYCFNSSKLSWEVLAKQFNNNHRQRKQSCWSRVMKPKNPSKMQVYILALYILVSSALVRTQETLQALHRPNHSIPLSSNMRLWSKLMKLGMGKNNPLYRWSATKKTTKTSRMRHS